ncbi:hypothetical protein [Mesorhizobium sp. CN2-181]|uniref:hypothetical protein n=1 Tax=Mesorhizobium yinganensis TaxID=3157707 RepID=UPI0032B791A4
MDRRSFLRVGALIAGDTSAAHLNNHKPAYLSLLNSRGDSMAAAFPLQRELRQSAILAGDGGITYGPFNFRIFDVEDVKTFVRFGGELAFTNRPATVKKVNDEAFDFFTVTFAQPLPVNAYFVVAGMRLAERSAAVRIGKQLDITALDIELSKFAATEQELRRDLGRALLVGFDQPSVEMPPSDGKSYLGWSTDGKLVNRLDAEAAVDQAQQAVKAAQAAAASVDIRRLPDIKTLRTLNSNVTKLAFLPDNTGFDWKEVDSTSVALFDPNEHMVVKDPETPLSLGAWYRRLKGDEPGVRDAFKAKGDGIADDTAALQDAIHWMEYYPLRSRALTWERGIYSISQLKIPNEIAGISFNGRSFWDSTIMCRESGGEPVIRNSSQEFKMFHMSLMSARPNSENWANHKNGLHNDKGIGETTDVDVTIGRCRIAGFYQGIYHKGRGLAAHNNHFASCHFGIGLDWPSLGDYKPSDVSGVDVFDDHMGFRGIAISNTRFHSMSYAAVANIGANANKIANLKINDIVLDIGCRIFYGHLGLHGSITDSVSTLSATEILELTGGRDFNVSGIVGGGNAKGGARTPQNLIKLTEGLFIGGRFSNMVLSNSEEHAIRDTSTRLRGVTFSDITFHDVGFDAPATSRAFSFGSQNSDIEIINAKLVGSDTLQGIVGNNYSNNRIRAINLSKEGNESPWIVGSTIILVGKRQRYSPARVNATNVIASSARPLEWFYLDDELIEIGGGITAQATAAGNCQVDLSLPVATLFTQPEQAWGALVAATAGLNVAGSVVANGTMLRLRWLAPNTNNIRFSFRACYRLI